MQVIGLMGYIDKHDFTINMAKILEIMNKSVLVIDATYDKKFKYIIPTMDTDKESYITNYSQIDFAVGFDSFTKLEDYMKENEVDISKYDYVLIDIDSAETYKKFNKLEFNRKYLFVDYSVLSVSKNKELIAAIRNDISDGEIKFTRILYKAFLSRAAENYLDTQIASYNITWQEENYEIVLDEQDKMVDIDSQFSGTIQMKKHTKQFLYSIILLIANLIEEDEKNILKQIKRRKD